MSSTAASTAKRGSRPRAHAPDSLSLPPETVLDESVPRRERKRQEVRDRLYRAAVSLFTEQGFEATTMDAISARADVARATVFNHFSQKIAFLEEWGVRRRAYVVRAMADKNLAAEPAAEQLRAYLHTLADLNQASRAQTAVLMDASWRFGALLRDPAPAQAMTQIVGTGVARGEIRPEAEPALVGQIISTSYFAIVLNWLDANHPNFALVDKLERMLEIVLRGVLA